MDECDRAQVQEEMWRDLALQSAHREPQGESLAVCERCQTPIPAARRQAVPGVRLCIDCAWDDESLRARGLQNENADRLR